MIPSASRNVTVTMAMLADLHGVDAARVFLSHKIYIARTADTSAHIVVTLANVSLHRIAFLCLVWTACIIHSSQLTDSAESFPELA